MSCTGKHRPKKVNYIPKTLSRYKIYVGNKQRKITTQSKVNALHDIKQVGKKTITVKPRKVKTR